MDLHQGLQRNVLARPKPDAMAAAKADAARRLAALRAAAAEEALLGSVVGNGLHGRGDCAASIYCAVCRSSQGTDRA